jgi:hypothetical protein
MREPLEEYARVLRLVGRESEAAAVGERLALFTPRQ